jgi:cytoskeleton protein RodZ
MNESPQQTPDADASGPLGGERLAVARRAHEISASDIAKELHLDEPKIRALEQNNFELLGAPVFAKGHLRKYAELVGVSTDDIIADYYRLNRAAGAPPIVGPARKFERDYAPVSWIAVGLVVIIVASASYWWFSRDPVLPPVVRTQAAVLAPFASDASDEPVQEETVRTAETAEILLEPEPLVTAEELLPTETMLVSSTAADFESEPLVEDVSLLPQVHVELSFTGDCWTEVSDASGRRLFYDLGTADRVVALAGDEPLQIVLGDSENVSITVEGRDYPISDYVRRGSLTRLTITSQ